MKRVHTSKSPAPEDNSPLTSAIHQFRGLDYTLCGKLIPDKETSRQKRRQEAEKPTKAEQREFQQEVEDLGRGPLCGLSIACSGIFEDITREKLELFI